MPAKILVVDDAPETLSLVEAVLKEKGYHVLTATNGIEGIKKVKADKPHLIIVDVLMPEMDGFVFYKELKKEKDTANIPIFILTVRARMEDTFRALGVEDFIVKPFDSQKLLDKVGSRLGFIPAGSTAPGKGETEAAQAGAEKVSPSGPQKKKVFVIGTSETVVAKMVNILNGKSCDSQFVLKESLITDKVNAFNPDFVLVETILNDRPAADAVNKLRNLSNLKVKPIVLFSYIDKDGLRGASVTQKAMDIENARTACMMAGATESMGGFEENHFLSSIQKYLM